MNNPNSNMPILIADDDPDDRFIIEEAWTENKLINPLYFVADGVELINYLKNKDKFADPKSAPKPGLILLDLNMPKMDGREALQCIKNDPELRTIPIIVLTTSKAEEDIYNSYDIGACSYITKPVTFDGLVKVLSTLQEYWLEIVLLPSPQVKAAYG